MPSSASSPAPRQLLAFTLAPGGRLEGRLTTALQRIESGGALSVLGALFVGRAPESGELVAVQLEGGSSAGMIGRLIGFRLDERERAQQTEQALAGPCGASVRAIAAALEPGTALAGLLVEHAWLQVLGEAVAALGGEPLADERVELSAEQAWQRLAAAIAERAG